MCFSFADAGLVKRGLGDMLFIIFWLSKNFPSTLPVVKTVFLVNALSSYFYNFLLLSYSSYESLLEL
jgi:hypothetical protein